jgi:NTE family protein
MSVPIFFQPFVVDRIPTGQESMTNWTKLASYEAEIPENVKIVDGGVLSNFPIYVFHNYKFVPRSPTFGVRLGIERDKPEIIGGIPELVKALFRTTRHILDYDFISQNQEYKKLICEIDTGKHYWLNFNLSDDDKKDLFAKGVLAAANFLREFDWQEYKKLRRRLIQSDN